MDVIFFAYLQTERMEVLEILHIFQIYTKPKVQTKH